MVRSLSQCQPRSRTADTPVGFLGHRVCGGPFRIGKALPYKTLRLQGCSFRLRPPRATLALYTAMLRLTMNSAPSSFCTRSVCPICLEGEATLAYLQRVRHSAPSLDVSFLRRIPYGLVIRRVIVIGNRARRAHVRMAPGVGCRLRTKGESNMADNREMWQSLGMDLETHDQLLSLIHI